MTKLSCLVIEDEPLLLNVLTDYISQVPFLELKAVYHDAVSAIEFIETQKVDLVFIDINLPKVKGIDFIRMFQGKSRFIITTAYHEYAVQGYELNVVDYLMKPIEFSRFLQAVKKVFDPPTINLHQLISAEPRNYLFVNINKKRVKINFNEILYIEGMKEYVKIYVSKEKWFITKIQMGQIQDMLNRDFVRVHRSYIVAKRKVTAYSLTEISMGNVQIPVGSNYRSLLTQQLEA